MNRSTEALSEQPRVNPRPGHEPKHRGAGGATEGHSKGWQLVLGGVASKGSASSGVSGKFIASGRGAKAPRQGVRPVEAPAEYRPCRRRRRALAAESAAWQAVTEAGGQAHKAVAARASRAGGQAQECRLTPRSRGDPPRPVALPDRPVVIVGPSGKAASRSGRLSSNVRRHRVGRSVLQQEVRLRRELEQPRRGNAAKPAALGPGSRRRGNWKRQRAKDAHRFCPSTTYSLRQQMGRGRGASREARYGHEAPLSVSSSTRPTGAIVASLSVGSGGRMTPHTWALGAKARFAGKKRGIVWSRQPSATVGSFGRGAKAPRQVRRSVAAPAEYRPCQ